MIYVLFMGQAQPKSQTRKACFLERRSQVSVPAVVASVVSVPKDDSDSSEKAAKKKTSDSDAAGRSVQRWIFWDFMGIGELYYHP